MPDITISTDSKPEEKKVDVQDIKQTLTSADEYQKLKEMNDKLEAEYIRQQELKAKLSLGGRTTAGQYTPEKTEEEKAKEEASKILSMYK